MKKYLFTAAIILSPVLAMAEHPEGGYINDIRSQIRDDERQLHEDREAGYTEAARNDERDLAEDKIRLREALKHPHDAPPPPPPPRDHDGPPPHHEGGPDDIGDQVNAAPPPPEHDEWRPHTSDKINPDRTFNHSARVDNEIR